MAGGRDPAGPLGRAGRRPGLGMRGSGRPSSWRCVGPGPRGSRGSGRRPVSCPRARRPRCAPRRAARVGRSRRVPRGPPERRPVRRSWERPHRGRWRPRDRWSGPPPPWARACSRTGPATGAAARRVFWTVALTPPSTAAADLAQRIARVPGPHHSAARPGRPSPRRRLPAGATSRTRSAVSAAFPAVLRDVP